MQNSHAIAAHWNGGFDEAGLSAWAAQLRAQLAAPRVSLGLVFLTPQFFPKAKEVLEILRIHAQNPLLAGCSSNGLISGTREVEKNAGLVLALHHLPGAELRALHFQQAQVEEANGPDYWHLKTGVNPDQTNGWLVFADPFHFDAEAWLRGWNEAYAPKPILGGLASGDYEAQTTQVYLNGDVFEEGGVAISIGGSVRLASVISQGCTPMGDTWTITKTDRNIIHEIGNSSAYKVLAETCNQQPPEIQKKLRGNLFVGLVINEYLEEFHRGDFLIRNLISADPNSGALAVAALPRQGQTIQFQRRDGAAATEDMTVLLERARQQLGGQPIYGGVLCCCNGRGSGLFGQPDHDARLVQERLGPLGLSGFFCNGEIGPVGERNFLHGYTAALALFVKQDPPPISSK